MLNLEDIQARADEFCKEFEGTTYESGHAQNFIRELCAVYGLNYLRCVRFEERIQKQNEQGEAVAGINRIDGFFPSMMLIEMKSAGRDMDQAFEQTLRYIPLLSEADKPRYVLVSDFQNLHLYDLTSPDQDPLRFRLSEFRQHVEAMGFLCGYEQAAVARQEAANAAAAETLADLHDAVKATGYCGKDLETLLVRILFCLFADDTGLFGQPHLFTQLIHDSRADGQDLSGTLDMLFFTLDSQTVKTQRAKNIYPKLASFPYINGSLFKGRIAPCFFDDLCRKALLNCCNIDWSEISPDIFGSLFQAIMHFEDEAATGKPKKRREFGEHYTSEANIKKAVDPLFLDDLKDELRSIRSDAKKLNVFLAQLRALKFLDPACGCGNFLVVVYRELRLLEEQALDCLCNIKGQTLRFPECNVDQFYGMDIDPSATQIATVALWLTDHQMNLRVKTSDGTPYVRLPLTAHPNIIHTNALRTDWNSLLPAGECSFVIGNPPYVGRQYQNAQQKEDTALIFDNIDGAGVLDYVAAWYVSAAAYFYGMTPAQLRILLHDAPRTALSIGCAFVSTNSITQGEQVGILWSWMLKQGIRINFAHRTFRWSNEGRGVAAVHCVIIGFALLDRPKKIIWNYPDVNDIHSKPERKRVKRINPYLVNAPDVVLQKRRTPISFGISEMVFGNMPNDGGHLLLSQQQADSIRKNDPIAAQYIHEFLGADEFINGLPRYCLWLVSMTEQDRQESPELQQRISSVKAMRLASARATTQKLANVPHLFGEIRRQAGNYLAIPEVSSERRVYVPIGFLTEITIASNKLYTIPNATLYDFGIVTSMMHMAWMRAVSGRLKSDYQYSAGIVYNNFPWPAPPKKLKSKTAVMPVDTAQYAIETRSQEILDARAAHPDKTLAWLYRPDTMPDDLSAAHAALDIAVDAAYGYAGKSDDASRVAFLFKAYQKLTTKIDNKN